MADANLDIRVTSKGIKEAHLALQKLGVNADKAEDAVKKYKEETKKNETAQKNYKKQQEEANEAVRGAAQVHKEARGGFRAMRGATQQLSFQLQDVAVQAQSGTAGLTILAQQGPQILSIFGPGGAVVGALVAFGALIGSVLVTAFRDSSDGAEGLEKSLDELDKTVVRTDNNILELSDRLQVFADRSKTALMAELIRSQHEARNAIKLTSTAILDSLDDYDGLDNRLKGSAYLLGQLEEAGTTASDVFTGKGFAKEASASTRILADNIEDLVARFGILPEAAGKLLKGAASLDSSDVSTFETFRDLLDEITVTASMAPQGGSRKFLEFTQSVQKSIEQLSGANETLGFTSTALDEVRQNGVAAFNSLVEGSAEASSRQVKEEAKKKERLDRLREQANTTVQDSIRKQQVMYSDAHIQFISQQEAQYQKQVELVREAGGDQEALADLRREIDQNILAHATVTEQKITATTEAENKKRLNLALQSAKQAQAQVTQAQSFVDSIMTAGMNQTERQLHNLDRQLKALNSLKDAEATYTNALGEEVTQRLMTQEQYAAAVQSIAVQTAQIQTEANKSYLDQWVEGTREAVGRIDAMQVAMAMSLESNMANAFEGILTGTMTVKEAFLEFTKGMLKAFLGAISQMIAKRIALAAVEKLMGKATAVSAATYMGLTAQAQSIMAGINAFTSTAAIPVVGPAAAPAAMATAIGITGPLAAAVTALSGAAAAARATGGQVRGGQSYLVGERGPELLTMGGSGRISSNDQLKNAVGGGGGITIVNNVDARGADASVDVKIRKAMQETAATTIETIRDLSRRRRFI